MKKKIFVAGLILLAICVGLGIPLAVANIQDAAIAAKSDSLDDATLGLGGRGSITLAQKYWMVCTQQMSSVSLTEGKYMTWDQARSKALDYLKTLEGCGVKCPERLPDGEYYVNYREPVLLVSDSNTAAPSFVAWIVRVTDQAGALEFLIDDETGALLALIYHDCDSIGWNGDRAEQLDMDKIFKIVGTFAELYGAEIIEINDWSSDDTNVTTLEVSVMFPGGLNTESFVMTSEAQYGANNVMTIHFNSIVYSFNDRSV